MFCDSKFDYLFVVDGSDEIKGVVRGCAKSDKEKCDKTTNGNIEELGYTEASGEYCFCKSDLCNSAPQTSVGRTAVSFTVASLLALAAARFLSQ